MRIKARNCLSHISVKKNQTNVLNIREGILSVKKNQTNVLNIREGIFFKKQTLSVRTVLLFAQKIEDLVIILSRILILISHHELVTEKERSNF